VYDPEQLNALGPHAVEDPVRVHDEFAHIEILRLEGILAKLRMPAEVLHPLVYLEHHLLGVDIGRPADELSDAREIVDGALRPAERQHQAG